MVYSSGNSCGGGRDAVVTWSAVLGILCDDMTTLKLLSILECVSFYRLMGWRRYYCDDVSFICCAGFVLFIGISLVILCMAFFTGWYGCPLQSLAVSVRG